MMMLFMETPASNIPPGSWQRYVWFQSLYGSPLRPSPQDAAIYWAAANEWIRERGAPRVLIMGVTPELYHLPWPEGTDILAMDRSEAMIEGVWPGPKETAILSDWLSMDLPAGSRDIILSDGGGLSLLEYPQKQSDLVRTLHRVLSNDGILISREFVLPSQSESPDLVLGDFVDEKIGNFSALALRLYMALQTDPEDGMRIGDAYEAIAAIPDLDRLVAKLGWGPDYLTLFDACRDVEARIHFLTLEQTTDLLCVDPGGFQVRRVQTPSYELGELCPTLTLQRS
jgi:hypothetical protein